MALELDDYKKTSWTPTMPITQDRMNKLEDGVYVNREAIRSLDNDVNGTDGLKANVETITAGIGTNEVPAYSSKTLWEAIKNLYNATTIEGQAQKIEQGAQAWAQILQAVGGYDELGSLKHSLLETLNAMTAQEQADKGKIIATLGMKSGENGPVPAYTDVDTVYKDIVNVRDILGKNQTGNAYYFNSTTDTVANKIIDLIRRMGDAETELYTNSISGTTYASLADRLNGMANSLQTLGGSNGAVPLLQAEVSGAHTSSVVKEEKNGELVNKVYETLDERFESIESNVSSNNSNISDIQREIAEAHLNAESTLDARFDAIDGGSAPTRTLPNVIGEINAGRGAYDSLNARFNADETNINHKVDKDNIYNDLDYVPAQDLAVTEHKVLDATQGKALKDLINSTDAAYKAADTALDNRLDAIETEISDARPQVGTDEESGEPIYGTLDKRLDDIESTATQIRNDVNTIAGELAMVDEATHSIKDTGTKIDIITNEINAAHRAVEEGEPADTLNTRFTDIESKISDAGGLTERLTSLEGEVRHETTGLTATKAIADANKAAIGDDNSGLTKRVHDLEGATEIISPADFEQLAANEANSHKDYLVGPDASNLYKYYRIIETSSGAYEKVLISGGGSGSGNNSAKIVETLPDAKDADANTDYYVGDNTAGYVHYRFMPTTIEGEEQLVGVPVGNYVDTNQIKQYRLVKRDIPISEGSDETSPWLFLYKFGYGESTDIESTETYTDPIWKKRLVDSFQLPSGGGSGSDISTIKIQRITPRALVAAKDNKDKKIYIRFFFTEGEGNETYRYSLSLNGRTIVNASKDTEITSGDPQNKSASWPEGNNVPTGFYSIDVTPYCTILGQDQPLVLTITSTANENIFATITWDLTVIQFNLVFNSADGLIVNRNEDVVLKYTPTGAINKTVHIKVGDNEYTRNLSDTITGREQEFIISAGTQSHGAHLIQMYMTANINNGNEELSTDPIQKEYIWYDPDKDDQKIIIASPGITEKVQSYSEIEIPFSVYHKDSGKYNIYYYTKYGTTNQQLIGNIETEGNYIGSFTYIPYTDAEEENQVITIVVDTVTLPINLTVTALNIDVSSVSGALIDFNPALYNNNSVNREPTWTVNQTTYSMKVSDNFNWSSNSADSGGGYREDDGKCFIIKAGSYVDINYPFFKPKTGTVFTNGAEMKIIFKTSAVRQADAVWFTSLGTLQNKTVGIQLNTHNGWLKTNKAVDYDTKDNEEEYPVWESGKTDYSLNDIVIYRKKSSDGYIIYKYIKLCKDFTIIAPDDSSMNKYWSNVTSEIWNFGTKYTKGAIVSVSNTMYQCIQDLTDDVVNISPANDTNNEYWKQINNWVSGTTYSKNDIVLYNNTLYKCIAEVVNQFVKTPKDLANKNWLAMGMTQTEISATNSYLYFPYSEDDKIELDININQYDSSKKNNFIMSYEDGVPSKAYAYNAQTGGDGITHANNIRIGSPDCDVYIYRLRIYNKSLTDEQILKNFIADGQTIQEKIERYNRNSIYWNNYSFTPSKEGAILDPIKLAEKMPNVKVLMLDTPRFTTGKKDFVKGSSLRCLQIQTDEQGNVVYPDEGNWFFQNGFHAGQGTTSDNYGQAGRNVDFLFECDGKHWPTKEKDIKDVFDLKGADKDYISSVLRGNSASKWDPSDETWKPTSVYDEQTQEWQPSPILTNVERANWVAQPPEKCTDWKGDKCKVALTPTSVPNNYFNLKVNIASSENVNNALFQKRYNDYVPYQSPAKERQLLQHRDAYKAIGVDIENLEIKNGMEFVPAVLFIRENDPDTKNHTEFTDCNWHFYALGNLGDSKKSDYTRAYDPTDMNEYTVENSDNNTNNGQFQSGVYFKDNNHNIRYLETEYNPWSNKIAYKTNEKVIYDGKLYTRIGENMTLPTLQEGEVLDLPWVEADWRLEPISITYDSVDMDWKANKVYLKGDLVYRNTSGSERYMLFRYKSDTPSGDAEWSADKWESAVTTYIKDDLLQHNGQLYRYDGEDGIEIGEWVAGNWVQVQTQLAGMTFLNPMSYIYPITTEEWNIKYNGKYLNNRHYTLLNEEFDGDHSFEFRYACLGDYRDGSLINDTNGDSTVVDPDEPTKFLSKDTIQFKLNQQVFYAFYEWIITTPRNKYRTEAPLWFVPSAAEFFYAFTHYYTMMDNRAKNTFWHFAKTDTRRAVPIGRAFEGLMHVYEEVDTINGGYKPAEAPFDNSKQYYTQYAFDLWVYDTDTAVGIDNNGVLIFPYGKEDGDFRVDGDPDSGYAFNGAGSIFWRRLKDPAQQGGLEDGIINVMETAKENCFSSQHLIDQFDTFQSYYPEEIWRLDIERKYIRTFTGINSSLPYDNAVSIGKQNTRFLTSMMQGRKKYQRRQWVRDQGVYFQSKYQLPEITTNNNEYSVTLGADPESLDVPVDYTLKLTPYQDMYLNVVLGNGTPVPSIRAKAGVEYSIKIPTSGSVQETRIVIQGGDYLSGVGNLAPMYPYSLMFSHIKRLKKFDMGTDTVGYTHTKLATNGINALGDGGGPLLEEINIKNCHSLASLPSLANSNNLRIIEAEGTSISSISLPDYTNIETLHLPTSVSELVLHHAIALRDFYIKNNLQEEDYRNLYTLSLVDSDRSGTFIWQPDTNYIIGDKYIINSNLYVCKKAHKSVSSETANNSEEFANYIAENWSLIKSNAAVSVDWISIATQMISNERNDIDINLQNLYSATITNINTLSSLADMKTKLEENGHTLELTGYLKVTGDWSQLEKNHYAGTPSSTWPDLILNVDDDKEVRMTKVIYMNRAYNQDGIEVPESEIETRYVSAEGIGDPIPDIYVGQTLPTRPSTKASIYQFGTINQGNYVPYSGWTFSRNDLEYEPLSKKYSLREPYRASPTVETVKLYTHFNASPHKYTVNWYLDEPTENQPKGGRRVKYVENQDFGGGYALEAPTVKEIKALGYQTSKITFNTNDTVTITLFDGWQKLPTNIDPSNEEAKVSEYNIYAKWYEKTISLLDSDEHSLFADTTDASSLVTIEQLAVLSKLNSSNRDIYTKSNNIIVGKRFSYQMGYDSSITGTTLVSLNNSLKFDENTNPIAFENIKPFKDNKGFTLAVDYQFDASQDSSMPAAVLMGCYDRISGSVVGFSLYKNNSSNYGSLGTSVGYGNMFSNESTKKIVGNDSSRNIIVLRHPANTSELWIYSSKTGTGSTLDSTIGAQQILLGTQVLSEDAIICFGHILLPETLNRDSKFSAEQLNLTGAYGTIYWAKYWDEDLGAGECKQIAAWPHENMAAILTSVETNISDTRPNIYLTNINNSSHGTFTSSYFSNSIGTVAGWGSSIAKTLCDNRVFNGLPIRLQSILTNFNIGYKNYEVTQDQYAELQRGLSTLMNSSGYVYLPSISSLNKSYSSSDLYRPESIYERNGIPNGTNNDLTPYSWIDDATGMEIKDYDPTVESGWSVAAFNANYYNIRFNNIAINWSHSHPLRIFRIAASQITNTTLTQIIPNIQPYDIVILSGNAAYMYVTSEDLNTGIQVVPEEGIFNPIIGSNTEGGWIQSSAYMTRSVTSTGTQRNNFIYINAVGSTTEPIDSNSQPGVLSLDYAFAI